MNAARSLLLASLGLLSCLAQLPAPPAGGARVWPPAKLAERAALTCQRRGEPQGPPSRAFETDGCTLWPEGAWSDCCVEHDLVYWCGGSRAERRESDEQLRVCASQRVPGWRGALLGALLRAGTRVGGAPWLATPWRWGYGHAYPSGYSPTREASRP